MDAGHSMGPARAEGTREQPREGSDQELEARASPRTPPRKGFPQALPWVQTPDSNGLGQEYRGRGRRRPRPLAPWLRASGLLVLTQARGSVLLACVHSTPLPAPSSLRVPSSKGRSHVCYWQLEGGLAPLSGNGDAIRQLKSWAPIGQN